MKISHRYWIKTNQIGTLWIRIESIQEMSGDSLARVKVDCKHTALLHVCKRCEILAQNEWGKTWCFGAVSACLSQLKPHKQFPTLWGFFALNLRFDLKVEVSHYKLQTSVISEQHTSSFTHVVSQRMLPLEEMLDSEAQRRRGSSRRGDAETTSSSSTTKPFAIPENKKKTHIHKK